jgi:hypothetical protein
MKVLDVRFNTLSHIQHTDELGQELCILRRQSPQ